MKSNRVIRNIAGKTVFAALWAAAFCLAGALAAQAQSYTKNYIYTVAGGGPVPTAPLSLDLPGPTAAVKDASGNIYFAAQDTAYVYKLSSTGVLSVFAGQGYGGYGGDGGPAAKALLGGVTGLAFDSKGNLYFADAVGTRIRVVNMGSTTITIGGQAIKAGNIATVAGNGTKCDKAGVCGDGGPALKANLNLPESVALDSAGNIYIADMTDNRIRVVNVGAKAITVAGVTINPNDIQTVAGNSQPCADVQGTPPTCGDGGPAHLANLTMPYGVAVDSTGNIYIADTKDQEIRVVAAGQADIETFAGNGTSCFNQQFGCGDGGAADLGAVVVAEGCVHGCGGRCLHCGHKLEPDSLGSKGQQCYQHPGRFERQAWILGRWRCSDRCADGRSGRSFRGCIRESSGLRYRQPADSFRYGGNNRNDCRRQHGRRWRFADGGHAR